MERSAAKYNVKSFKTMLRKRLPMDSNWIYKTILIFGHVELFVFCFVYISLKGPVGTWNK